MILDNILKNLIYDPVSILGLLVFYILLVNLPISLSAVFKKKIISYCKTTYHSSEFINHTTITL